MLLLMGDRLRMVVALFNPRATNFALKNDATTRVLNTPMYIMLCQNHLVL